MSKPKLCEILGVEVLEEFIVKDVGRQIYRITEDGKREVNYTNNWRLSDDEEGLEQIIKDPSLIIKKPTFTNDELAILRQFKKANILSVRRYNSVELVVKEDIHDRLLPDFLPSLKNGVILDLTKMDLGDEDGKE